MLMEDHTEAAEMRAQENQVVCFSVAAKQSPLYWVMVVGGGEEGHSNFLTCLDLKPKSICIRLAVCQCRPGFQAPPVLGKLNWQFSILFRSEGQAADSRKNKTKQKPQIKTHRPDKQEMRQRAMTSVGQTDGSFRWILPEVF